MKLLRFGPAGCEQPGIVDAEGILRDASAFGEDWGEGFFGGGGLRRLADWLPGRTLPALAPGTRLGPPIRRPSKIVCVGLNYADHVRETGAEMPVEPVLFAKATSSLAGPCDDVRIPRGGSKVDWEVELAVVVGACARYVLPAQAMQHVAGYCVHNDYSERAFQMERGGQFFKGKSCDTFAPLGPWLVTRDEIADPSDLRLWLAVNGRRRQDSSTHQMIFDVPYLISYISQFMTLLPGDVISTGTPPGVGLAQDPPVFLRARDVVELGIDQLGTQRQTIVAEEPA